MKLVKNSGPKSGENVKIFNGDLDSLLGKKEINEILWSQLSGVEDVLYLFSLHVPAKND